MDPKGVRISSNTSKNNHKGSGSKFYTNPQAKPPADDNITGSLASAAGGSKADKQAAAVAAAVAAAAAAAVLALV